MTALFAVLCRPEPGAAQDQDRASPVVARESLQIGISVDRIGLSSEFSGTQIAVFGAIENADPVARLRNQYAIVVAIAGPEHDVVVRQKERVFGIWINTQSRTYRGVPSFYRVASSGRLDDIAQLPTLRRSQIGVDNLSFNLVSGEQGAFVVPQPRFAASLRRIRLTNGLFAQNPTGVVFLGSSLFRASLQLPSNVPVGRHTVTAYLLRDGELLATRSDSFVIEKIGFEKTIYALAHEQSFLYGLLAVLVALTTGWLASVIFGRK